MFGTKSKPLQVLLWIFLAILALLPFHAIFSTWAISNFGHELIFKAWKEALLFFVALPLAVWVTLTDKKIIKTIISSRLNQLIFGYILLNVVMALVGDNPHKVVAAGLAFNLRFFVMFLIAQVLALKVAKPELREFALRILFWGGLVVSVFGALQVLVLPHDILRHIGYRDSIIHPFYIVDGNPDLVRIVSTLRGPNILGAYMVFWLPILALVTRRMWNVATKYRVWAGVIWLCALITLYGSGSRASFAGALVALGIFTLLSVNAVWRQRLLVAGTVVFLLALSLLALNRHSSFVQITLFHRDPSRAEVISSNAQHASSLSDALHTIRIHPLGSGTGSTNLASTYGTKIITVENYYLQIAEELGVIGLILFIAIICLVVIALWQLRHDDIAAALLAGFIGVGLVDMLLPAMNDETLSMLWWGMCGLTLYTASHVNKKKKALKK